MSSYLNGSSLLAGIQSGMSGSYSILSNLYSSSGGLTKTNLASALTNSSVLTSGYGNTFASYLNTNFSTLDKNRDGTLSATEVQTLMNQISTQGLTRSQITSLGAMSGISSDMQGTILDHFNDIDTNHDGKVTSGEIQAYNLTSKMERRKVDDENKMIKNMSLFYGNDDKEFSSSLLSYKWLADDATNNK